MPRIVQLSFALLFLPAAAIAQPIIGVLAGREIAAPDAGAVVSIHPGGITVLGTPIPGEGLGGVARLNDGRIMATTEASLVGPSRLIEIDPDTGALVAVIGELAWDEGIVGFHDLAVDPADGRLYGAAMQAFTVSRNTIFEIDPATAFCTRVAITPLQASHMSIAFTSDGARWGKYLVDPRLFRLDEGFQAVETINLDYPWTGHSLGALNDDNLISSECCTDTVGTGIYQIALGTGHVTLLGSAGANRVLEDITVTGVPAPAVEVPALGARGLAALALLLAAAGGLLLRRR